MRSADELRVRDLINKQKTVALNSLELRELLRLRDKVKKTANETKKKHAIQGGESASPPR